MWFRGDVWGKEKKTWTSQIDYTGQINCTANVSVQEMNKKSRQLKTAASVLAAAISLLPALPKTTFCSHK